MVKVLLSLKWRYVLAQFKGNVWAIVGLVFGLLYGIGILIAGVTAMFFAGSDPVAVPAALIFASLLLSLLWWLVPLFLSGVDETIDPERLVLFPLKRKDVQLGQFLAAFIGIPGVLTLLFSFSFLVTVRKNLLAVIVGLVLVLLQLSLAVTVSRLVTLLAFRLSSKRTANAIIMIIGMFLFLGAGPMMGFGSGYLVNNWDKILPILQLVSWTPLAAGAGSLADTYSGHYLPALLKLLLICLYLLVAWKLWSQQLRLSMENVGESKQASSGKNLKAGQLGIFDRFPATARGAIAARTLHMMLRDRRLTASILMIPFFYLIFTISSLRSGVGTNFFLLLFLPATAGYLYANLVSLENSAFAMHVYSPVTGKDDRWGRAQALLILMSPLLLLGSTFMTLLSQDANQLLLNWGLTFGIFLTAIGLGAYTDMVLSVPAPPPGASPFKMSSTQNNTGAAKGFARILVLLITLAFSIPGYAGWIAYALTGNMLWGTLGGIADVLVGVGVLFLGIKLGAKRFDRLSPETLQRVSKFSD